MDGTIVHKSHLCGMDYETYGSCDRYIDEGQTTVNHEVILLSMVRLIRSVVHCIVDGKHW